MNIIKDKEMKKHRGSGAFLMLRSHWQRTAGFPKARRVQAPHGARVLSLVRFAPTDGFRPQSGLVQRELYSIAAAGSCIPESKRGAPAFGGQGLSPALSRGPRVV